MMSAALGVLLTAHVSQDPMFSLTLRADGVLGARAWRLRREIEVNLIEIGCCPLEPSNRAEPPRRGDEAMRQMRFVSPIVRMRIAASNQLITGEESRRSGDAGGSCVQFVT